MTQPAVQERFLLEGMGKGWARKGTGAAYRKSGAPVLSSAFQDCPAREVEEGAPEVEQVFPPCWEEKEEELQGTVKARGPAEEVEVPLSRAASSCPPRDCSSPGPSAPVPSSLAGLRVSNGVLT